MRLFGATGTGVNAPPIGTLPFNAKLWDAKNYLIPHHAASCPQPPQNAAARLSLINSPIALTYFGLPARAQNGWNTAKWQEVVAHMQKRSCDYTTPIKDGHPFVNNGGSTINTLWGGYGNSCTSGCYSYQAADFHFYVPSIVATTSSDDSIWAGIGGANGQLEAFSQDGVAEDSTLRINSYSAFFESNNCNEPNVQENAYGVSPGDYMYVYTDRYGTDYLDDFTKGIYQTKYWGCGATDTAEFIIERNGGCTLLCVPLANYLSMEALYAEFEDSSNTWYRVNALGSQYTWYLDNAQKTHALETMSGMTNDSYGSDWIWYFQTGS